VSWDGKVDGINNLQRRYQATYGPGNYKPSIPVTYWTFRLMMGFGFLAGLLALAGLWLTRRGRLPRGRWFYRAGLISLALPYLANTMGWIFTEMGRQPWTVFGVLRTRDNVSPSVATASVVTSLTVFTLLYAGLAVIAAVLMVRQVRSGPPTEDETPGSDQPLPAFTY
jgi:cytochrome d ubiquinol oxidase subunit I